MPWFLRTRLRLFATLLVVLAIPFGFFSYDVALRAGQSIQDQTVAMNGAVARLGADAVQAHFESLKSYVGAFAIRPALHKAFAEGNAADVRALLRELVEGNTNLGRAFVSDLGGVERYDWPVDESVIGRNFSYRDWYKGVASTGKIYVSEIYERAALPKLDVVAIAVPIEGGERKTLGYLVAQCPIDSLIKQSKELLPPGAGSITLFDQHGRPAMRRSDSATKSPDQPGKADLAALLAPGTDFRFGSDPVTREPSLVSWAPVEAAGWHVVASMPTAAVYAPVKAFQTSLLFVSLVCLAGMLGLGFIWLNVVRRHHLALLDLQRQKDLLGGMILHDLRNPLAVTLGSIDLVRAHSGEMDPLLREDLTRAAHSAARARELLNTLLDIMRMEEGVLALRLERLDLGSLVRARVDEFQPLAHAASVTLSSRLPGKPVEVTFDPSLIGRVLDNLMANAAKHTPPGGRIDVQLEPDAVEKRVVLTVEDTGEGIPAEGMALLFQKFAPILGQRLKRPHDTGLGLVFCRMAVERHGGTIDVRSEPGRGSVFRVVLPSQPK